MPSYLQKFAPRDIYCRNLRIYSIYEKNTNRRLKAAYQIFRQGEYSPHGIRNFRHRKVANCARIGYRQGGVNAVEEVFELDVGLERRKILRHRKSVKVVCVY